MSIVEPGSTKSNLVARVIAILTKPGTTWDEIDAEPADVAGLYRGYIIPLAAIPAVCAFIGLLAFGAGGMFGISIRFSPVWLLAQMVVSYLLGLAMVFILALIIENLAPNFGGVKDRVQAFKVAAYAPTASWVAGVFSLIPALSIVGLLGGLYSLYLLFLGLPRLMKTPQEKAGPYFGVVLVVTIVVSLVFGMITGAVLSMGRGIGVGGLAGASSPVTAKINLPGGQGSVDLGKLEAASQQAQAAAAQMQSGKTTPATDPEILKGYLPPNLGGLSRSDVSSSTGGMGGIQGSQAEASYENGDARIHLEVTDVGAAGGLAAMAGAFHVNSSKETATGYEKVNTEGGRMTQESYDRSSKHGEYSIMVGQRFMVQAEGDNVGMDQIKAAVNAVGLSRLEAMAKGG